MNSKDMKTLSFRDLERAVKISEYKSFYEASNKMGLSPSTMSRMIARVEKALGYKIYTREVGAHNGAVITDQGVELKARYQAAINALIGESNRDVDEVLRLKARLEIAESKLLKITKDAQQYADNVANIATNE